MSLKRKNYINLCWEVLGSHYSHGNLAGKYKNITTLMVALLQIQFQIL